MTIVTKTYTSKPIQVEAIQITEENMDEVAKWCRGKIETEKHKQGQDVRYIRAEVYRAQSERQTKGYVGDWILDRNGSYKVFTNHAFQKTYEDGAGIPMAPDLNTVGSIIFEQLKEQFEMKPRVQAPQSTTIKMGDNVGVVTFDDGQPTYKPAE